MFACVLNKKVQRMKISLKYISLVCLIFFFIFWKVIPKRFPYSFLKDNDANFGVGNKTIVENISGSIYTLLFGNKALQEENLYSSEVSRIVSRSAVEKVKWYRENFKHLPDQTLIPSPKYSKMFLSTNKTEFNVGEDIEVHIHLYNYVNNPLNTGGDILRVWITDKSSHSNTPGYVIDHGNGKYTGVVKALFPGTPLIKSYLALTKFHVGIFYDYIEREGIWFYMKAKFKKLRGSSTWTYCSTIPIFSTGQRTCNFTKINYGLPWYCRKPEKYGLTCADWVAYSKGPFNYLLQKRSYGDFFRKKKNQYLSQSLKVSVRGERAKIPDIACYRRPNEKSWEDHVPTGYFYNKSFYSLQCYSSHLSLSRQAYQNCLRGRPVHLYGDSTLRYWFVYLTKILKIDIKGWDVRSKRNWQKPIYADDKDLNISLIWAPHELPMFGTEISVDNIRSVASRLSEIPADSKGIVVLHWYLHMVRMPPSAYRTHVHNARIAVVDLLKRAPHINVFIKGPHAVMFKEMTEPHDYARRIYEQIVYEEFASVRDKVTYLNQWDSSVSSENIHAHPPTEMSAAMVHHLMSYVCTDSFDNK